jgi:hypothetical protein
MKIYGQELSEAELKIVSKYCNYVCKEPGQNLINHGVSTSNENNSFYLVLKGCLLLQIPDNSDKGKGIIEHKEVQKEEVVEEVVEENAGNA